MRPYSEQQVLAVALTLGILVMVVGSIEYSNLWPLLSVATFGAVAGRYGYLIGRK